MVCQSFCVAAATRSDGCAVAGGFNGGAMLAPVHRMSIPLAPSQQSSTCLDCGLRSQCLPSVLAGDEIERLSAMAGAPRKIKRGQYLCRNGDKFTAISMIKAGHFKTELVTSDGRRQVTGFQMPGDLLGIDGLDCAIHTCDAVALVDSQVCQMSFTNFEVLASEVPSLQRHFHKLLSHEIVRDQGTMMLLGAPRAEGRLAAFLLNMSQRFAASGYSPTEFHLRMTRAEIGSYLGLTLETVSRAFSKFQEDGLVSMHLKHVCLLDVDRLKRSIW